MGQEKQRSARAEQLWERIGSHFAPPPALREDYGEYAPLLRFADGRPAASAADWQRRRRELLDFWHRTLGPWPPLLANPTLRAQGEEKIGHCTRIQISIEIAPERAATAYLLLPEGEGPFPALVDVFYSPEDGAGLNPQRRMQNDFGYQMAQRGFVALCIGLQPGLEGSPIYYPGWEQARLQPLSYLAYVAANGYNLLAQHPRVAPERVGVVGHSYGGKWAMFAACLYEKFACAVVSDPGIVFDESRPNVNYWEPWYLGHEPGKPPRKAGVPTGENPRTGVYRRLREEGHDLHELHALMAPRPLFVAGGSEDPPERWKALNHLAGVNRLLGAEHRVGMANRADHALSAEANQQICHVLEYFLNP